MKIQSSFRFFDMYNLSNKKNKTMEEKEAINKARKQDPVLDSLLYSEDLAKVYQEQSKVEQIAKKIATGKNLTQEEREYINKVNPDLARKANMAKQESESLKRRLKTAKNKKQAQSMLAQACVAAQAISKQDPQYGSLIMEGIKEVNKEFNENNPDIPEVEKYKFNQQKHKKILNIKG